MDLASCTSESYGAFDCLQGQHTVHNRYRDSSCSSTVSPESSPERDTFLYRTDKLFLHQVFSWLRAPSLRPRRVARFPVVTLFPVAVVNVTTFSLPAAAAAAAALPRACYEPFSCSDVCQPCP